MGEGVRRTMSEEKINLIQSLIDQLSALPHRDNGKLDALQRRAKMIIKKVYGDSSSYLSDLDDIGFLPWVAPCSEESKNEIWESGKRGMLNLFNTMIEELRIGNTIKINDDKKRKVKFSNKIFIVHGHDNLPKEELARILTQMGLEPIILHERPNQGRTIIEKYEEECSDVGYAFVIMTPDDVGMDRELYEKIKKGESKNGWCYRARQNVVLELGLFFAKLGRHRVCCLCKGDNLEKPRDIDGILYLSFKEHIEEIYRDIIRELRAADYKPKV
jgi:predicted nucleotide-binding protein